MSKALPFKTAVRKETLAEQVASSIKEAILAGQWTPGEALPTEPALADAFGVSRAVVRDATRMLAARGLVVAQHGRGVFVTESQVEAFGDALLLALRREGASVWDVEQFEQTVFPEVCALAASAATDEEIAQMRSLADAYIARYSEMTQAQWEGEDEGDKAARAETGAAFTIFLTAVFAATHNAMWHLLAQPLLRLRSMRYWDTADYVLPAGLFPALEKRWVDTVVEAVASRNAEQARSDVAQLMRLPQEAEEAMRDTPVGEKPHIRVARA